MFPIIFSVAGIALSVYEMRKYAKEYKQGKHCPL